MSVQNLNTFLSNLNHITIDKIGLTEINYHIIEDKFEQSRNGNLWMI